MSVFPLSQTVIQASVPVRITHEPEHASASTSANNSPVVKHKPEASQEQYRKSPQRLSFSQTKCTEIRNVRHLS